LFGFGDRVFDLFKVGIEFHSPLVEIASSYRQEPHRELQGRIGVVAVVENCEGDLFLYSLCALILRSYDENSNSIQSLPDPWTGYIVD
jgi:hypothetical protein